jgi:hypothetical protein
VKASYFSTKVRFFFPLWGEFENQVTLTQNENPVVKTGKYLCLKIETPDSKGLEPTFLDVKKLPGPNEILRPFLTGNNPYIATLIVASIFEYYSEVSEHVTLIIGEPPNAKLIPIES